jgi:site-specific recombinase XerD
MTSEPQISMDIVPAAEPALLAPANLVYDDASVCLAVDAWAEATSDPSSPRVLDLRRDKTRTVLNFFDFARKHPAAVSPLDVQAWQRALKRHGRKESTIYQHTSFLSSFYRWAMKDKALAQQIHTNPVTLARPKAPKPYQSSKTKALSDDDVRRLLDVLRARAASDDPREALIGKRDYALFLLYLYTGLRRREVVQLRWEDMEFGAESMTISTQTKGSTYRTLEVAVASMQAAIRAYVEASGRWGQMTPDSPLWLAHDTATTTTPDPRSAKPLKQRGRHPEDPLSTQAFDDNLRRYAAQTGIPHIHIHQLRHTFARLIGEEADDLYEVQRELGHSNINTTRIYLDKVAKKKDKLGKRIAKRFGNT